MLPSRFADDRVVFSLAVLGAVVAFALVGLAVAGNWPKVLRVAAAAAAYAIVLLAMRRGRASPALGAYIMAGAAAGAVSGVARPVVSPAIVIAGTLGAGLLLGPLHWWSVRRGWRA